MRPVYLMLGACAAAGCSRAYYRAEADRETYPILQERVVDPAFEVGRTRVEPEPASRLADPLDPDRPPKPPDDAAAAKFMAHPYKFRGSSHWDRYGFTDRLENPGWAEALGLKPGDTLKIDQDKAVEIALVNNREYQTAIETLYLQALSLTQNRFEFDLRWFGRNSTTYTRVGTSAFPTETNTLAVDSSVGFERNLAAGGQLLVDFANSVVLEFTGGTTQVRSNIGVTLVQPLLRGFGRQVRLEGLTQAERNTLYAVRDFARFRKQFWAGVAVGASSSSFRSSFSSSRGFGGASSLGIGPGTSGLTGTSAVRAASIGSFFGGTGYLDLLFSLQAVRNAEANLKRQDETYRLYNELFRGGRASVVEVDQFYQSLESARLNVVEAEVEYADALDGFKLQLGIPTRVPVEIDDKLLDPFVLSDPKAEQLRDDLEAFQRQRFAELDELPDAAALAKRFGELKALAGRAPAVFRAAAADVEKLGKQLDSGAAADTGADGGRRDRAREARAELAKQVPELSADLDKALAALERHRTAAADADRRAGWELLTGDVKTVLGLVDAALAAQTQARIYSIELPEVKSEERSAVEYALGHRLDLMNQLASVTDAWRKVTVAANALRGDLSVVASADVGSDPSANRPFSFAAEASSYSVGLRFDGPLNRLAERNAYRAALIDYQQAKRAYVESADSVEFSIRSDLRNLRLTRAGFEATRQQLLSAARQYENARLTLLGPRDRRAANDTTTLNLLQALQSLLQTRNLLARFYIQYEQQRVQLLLDLEALQLDQRGFPLHDPRTRDGTGPGAPAAPAGEPLPPPRPVAGPAGRAGEGAPAP